MTHHHDQRAPVLLDPGADTPGVAMVDPDQADAPDATFDRLKPQFHSLAILDSGCVHDHVEQQSYGVHEQVSFA